MNCLNFLLGLETPTGNRADKAHPNPALHHLLPGDNLLRKRKGIGSKSTKKTPEQCKIRMKEKRNIEILTTERSVADREILNLPRTATARRNISHLYWLHEKCSCKTNNTQPNPSKNQVKNNSLVFSQSLLFVMFIFLGNIFYVIF